MKHIIIITLVATCFGACKKELTETRSTAASENANSVINAPAPCTGNAWTNDQVYKAPRLVPPLIYNNKAYMFDHSKNKLFTFDGANWDSTSLFIPFNHYPTYAFTIGNKGYLGYKVHPIDAGNFISYLWEYDFITKVWSSKPPYPGSAHFDMAVFTIAGKGYLAGGGMYTGNANPLTIKNTWEFSQKTSSWAQKANLPFIGVSGAAGFSIGNKGYIVNGTFSEGTSFATIFYLHDLYEYNPSTNTWSLKTPFPGSNQTNTNVFVIGSVVYAGGGSFNNSLTELPHYYKYYPAIDQWSQIANFPVPNRPFTSFSINSKGYVVYKIPDPPYTLRICKYTPSSCSGTSQ